jgi:ABC-type dipeptide/oligopeptide/nickel transport system permease subunit
VRQPARRGRPASAPRTRRPLLRQPAAVAALGWLAAVVACTALAPLLAPAGPAVTQPSRALLPPGPGGPMGTDFLGRSVAARLVWGGRLTLAMGAGALALAIALGLPVGLAAGSLGGWADSALMRGADALLAFPGLLLAMAVLAVLGVGLGSVTLAVGLAAAPAYARIARSVAREMRIQPYIEAARAIGASPLRVAVRHVLPNAGPALVAFAGAQLGWILLTGAALSYLGLGAAPGTPEWGMMLADGRGYLRDAPWASVFPGLALTLTVLAANLLGDAWQTSQVR